jgi:hypothetical protein
MTTLRINVNTADALTLESLTPTLLTGTRKLQKSDRHDSGALTAEIPELRAAADAMAE